MPAGATCWHAFPTTTDCVTLNHKPRKFCLPQGAACQVFGHTTEKSNQYRACIHKRNVCGVKAGDTECWGSLAFPNPGVGRERHSLMRRLERTKAKGEWQMPRHRMGSLWRIHSWGESDQERKSRWMTRRKERHVMLSTGGVEVGQGVFCVYVCMEARGGH